MKFRKRSIILIAIILVVLVTSVFAWINISKKTPPLRPSAGVVSITHYVYVGKNGNDYITPQVKKTYGDNYKSNIYALNISDFDNINHINNLRVDFLITSIVDTYFRVRIVDTMTLTYLRDGKLVELNIPRSSKDAIDYEIDYKTEDSLWYYDEKSDWYYYKASVTEVDGLINFITQGLGYPLWPSDYEIQFGIIIEAVQAKGGPLNNWGLTNPPWDEESDW